MKIINKFLMQFFIIAVISCTQEHEHDMQKDSLHIANCRTEIAGMLDSMNIAAAEANYEKYFDCFAKDAVYLGTDATEHWSRDSFMLWARPFFERGKAWNFKSIERHIYFGENSDIAWFDELLKTQMKICRGSGVVVKENGKWKIAQYVLSMTVPNSKTDSVVILKSNEDDIIINRSLNNL